MSPTNSSVQLMRSVIVLVDLVPYDVLDVRIVVDKPLVAGRARRRREQSNNIVSRRVCFGDDSDEKFNVGAACPLVEKGDDGQECCCILCVMWGFSVFA